jgi:hypothetical protein
MSGYTRIAGIVRGLPNPAWAWAHDYEHMMVNATCGCVCRNHNFNIASRLHHTLEECFENAFGKVR